MQKNIGMILNSIFAIIMLIGGIFCHVTRDYCPECGVPTEYGWLYGTIGVQIIIVIIMWRILTDYHNKQFIFSGYTDKHFVKRCVILGGISICIAFEQQKLLSQLPGLAPHGIQYSIWIIRGIQMFRIVAIVQVIVNVVWVVWLGLKKLQK